MKIMADSDLLDIDKLPVSSKGIPKETGRWEGNRMADEQPRKDHTKDPPEGKKEQEAKNENRPPARKSRKKPEYDPEKIKLTVGQLIGVRRRSLGWTQEELSWRSGISVTQISRIERDLSDPTLSSIEGLESALDMELYDLFMAQKKLKVRRRHKRKGIRNAGDALGAFERELARKGVSEGELKDVLDEALKSVDSLKKGEEKG